MASVLGAAAAWPCSLSGDPERVEFATPSSHSRGVPLNAEVKAIVSGEVRPGDTWTFTDADSGEPVPFAETTLRDHESSGGTLRLASLRLVRLRPREALAPNHRYRVTWRGREESVFETGEGVDTTAPTAPGPVKTSFLAEEDSCFGDTRRFNLAFDASADPQTPQGQLLYLATFEGADGPRMTVMRPADLTLGETRRMGNLAFGTATDLEGKIEALDWAGNVGAPRALHASLGLDGTSFATSWRRVPEGARLVASSLAGLFLFVVLGAVGLTLRRNRTRA